VERAKKSVSDADKNNINESARAIGRNTPFPHPRNGKRPRASERDRQTRAWQIEYLLGIKMEQRFLRGIEEKDVRAHGNENFDDMRNKKSTKYKREAKRRTEANVAVCAATERESANIFFSFFYEEGNPRHVTTTWKIEEDYASFGVDVLRERSYLWCVCIYIYMSVRCSMCLSLLSLRFTNGGFAQHVFVGDFPRTAHRVEVSF
jgi:hypothetical protein